MTEQERQYLDHLNNMNFETETEQDYINRIKAQNKFKQDNKNL